MHYPKTRRLLLLTLALATAVAAAAFPRLGHADTAAETSAVTEYLGKWNYDLPDRTTGTNIAVIDLPGGLKAPQVGDIVFTADGRDRIVGRTDVGCTWRFAASRASLELDPAGQYCHNPTLNLAYTITSWTVVVDGTRETESITAISHHPTGDHDFVLDKGARTKTREYDPEAAAAFAGTWHYDPADQTTGVNIRTTVTTAPDGTRTTVRTPEEGTVTIAGEYGNRLTARTGDGCTWSLVARGNTARLDPAIQTCTLPGRKVITMRSWTVATDGTRQATMMTGTDQNGGVFALSAGSLGRA